jgi:hypothetical protein
MLNSQGKIVSKFTQLKHDLDIWAVKFTRPRLLSPGHLHGITRHQHLSGHGAWKGGFTNHKNMEDPYAEFKQ